MFLFFYTQELRKDTKKNLTIEQPFPHIAKKEK